MIPIEEIVENHLSDNRGVLDLNVVWWEYPPESISDEMFDVLVKIIETNESIRSINVVNLNILRSDNLEGKINKIARLFSAIRNNPNIKEVIFEKQDWLEENATNETFNLYVQALQNPNLKRFGIIHCEFDHNISEERVSVILAAISENPNINYLNFSNNALVPVRDHLELGNHLSMFCNYILNSKIRTLILSNCVLGEDQHIYEFRWNAITNAIAKNNSIRTLDLSNNNLGEIDHVNYNTLVNAIRQNENILFVRIKNKTCQHSSLDESSPSKERINAIQEILAKRVSSDTYFTRVATRTLKKFKIGKAVDGQVLPTSMIGNILTFLHKNQRLRDQVMSSEFPKLSQKPSDSKTVSEAKTANDYVPHKSVAATSELEKKQCKEKQEYVELSVFYACNFFDTIYRLPANTSYEKLLDTALDCIKSIFPDWIQKRLFYGEKEHAYILAKSALARLIPCYSRNAGDSWISNEKNFLLQLALSSDEKQKIFFDALISEVTNRFRYSDAIKSKI